MFEREPLYRNNYLEAKVALLISTLRVVNETKGIRADASHTCL